MTGAPLDIGDRYIHPPSHIRGNLNFYMNYNLCMKKIILFIHFYFFVSIVNAHSGRTDSDGGHYKHSDGSYHYHGSGGLGDWTGTESIGAWLGVFLVVGFIVWFIKEYPNSKEQYEKEKQSKLEYEQKHSKSEDELDPFAESKTSDNLTLVTDEVEYHITGIENGKSVLFYENGSKLYEGNWVNGKQEGTSFVYFDYGAIWIEMNHKAGIKNGSYISYYYGSKNNESPAYEGSTEGFYYESDKNYKDGKLEGRANAWYPNGSMKYAEEYLNGVLQEKDSVYFDKNGNISTKEQLELEEQQE